MFEHLDDPRTFRPDEEFRTAVMAGSRSHRRRQAAVRAGAGGLLVLAVLAGVVAVDVFSRVERIQRVEVTGVASDGPPGAPSTVLFVGTDSGGDLISSGGGPAVARGSRTDSVVLARVDPAAHRLTVLPLPRDLWVDVAGSGPARINQASALGSPAALVETIETELGIEVDHYLALDFAGAIGVGDALGGLDMEFPKAVRDQHSGFAVDAGCRSLDGAQILGLSRSRRLEQQGANGLWQRDPTGDIGRIERQQAVAAAVFARISALDASSPGELDALLDIAVENVTIDSETTPAELLTLIRAVAGSDVVQLRLPVLDAVEANAQVLVAGLGAHDVLEQIGATDPAIVERPSGRGPAGDPSSLAAPVVPTPC